MRNNNNLLDNLEILEKSQLVEGLHETRATRNAEIKKKKPLENSLYKVIF